jgi:hypothetical protein
MFLHKMGSSAHCWFSRSQLESAVKMKRVESLWQFLRAIRRMGSLGGCFIPTPLAPDSVNPWAPSRASDKLPQASHERVACARCAAAWSGGAGSAASLS